MPLVLNRCPRCGQEEQLEFEEVWASDEGFAKEAEAPVWNVLCMDCIHSLHDEPALPNVSLGS